MDDDRVVVVGSGPCGAAAAAQLVERGVDVVLLDAGRRAPRGLVVKAAGNTLYRRMGWSAYADDRHTGEPDVDWYSSLSLGGLSNFWTSAVPRFEPEDFTDGARLDDRYRWPIGYDDLVPWYEAAERMLTVTAGDLPRVPANVTRYHHRLPDDWQDVVTAAAAQDHALGAIPMAKGHPWMIALRGAEFSSYHCVLAPLRRAPNFRLVPGAFVSRLIWSPSEERVVGVEHVDETGGASTTLCRAVVLAAGAVDTTAILLRSRSAEFPAGLGNDRGLVGRYLHDHPRQWWRATTSRPLTALAHPVYVARRAHAESPPLMATSLTIGLAAPVERLRTYYRGRTTSIGVQVFGTMVPEPEIGVSIADAGDVDPRTSRPTIRLRYDEQAVDNTDSARDRLQEVMACAGIDVEIPGPFHELRPGSSVHFGGTVRMHADPGHGALDGWNRIHDAPNVVVADLSCFTTGPEKNPTLTAMAIALRAADRLASDLGSRPPRT